MFWTTFLRLCNEHGTRPNPVAQELGISSGSITKWKNGSLPRDATLQKIADYFEVSVDYLLGKEDPPKEKPATESDGQLDEARELFSRLSPEAQAQVLNYMKFLEASAKDS